MGKAKDQIFPYVIWQSRTVAFNAAVPVDLAAVLVAVPVAALVPDAVDFVALPVPF
jgi:hypothetical protein